MADIAASVLARLKNKAAESGRSYQLCLQLFCQEEFLRRLEKSQYAENLVLKGGLFIYSVTDFDSRVTVDVDFLLRKVPNTPEQLQTVIETIISMPTGNDFVTFEIKDIAKGEWRQLPYEVSPFSLSLKFFTPFHCLHANRRCVKPMAKIHILPGMRQIRFCNFLAGSMIKYHPSRPS